MAQAVRKAAKRCRQAVPSPASQTERVASVIKQPPTQSTPAGPRSSNLRVAKSFTQRDKDQFLLDSFEYIARYFENSLHELQARNPDYEGVYRRIDANRFSAVIYKDGQDIARGTVFTEG